MLWRLGKALFACLASIFSACLKKPQQQQSAPPGGLQRFESGLYDKQYDDRGGRVFPAAEVHRKEASRQAELRGECFEKSQAAFMSGDKQQAHTLSVAGKKHGKLMEEANERAVEAIVGPQRILETGCLDLHGLHVKEAKHSTEQFMRACQGMNKFSQIEIITGAGHHSKGGHSKIRPEIEKTLRQSGLSYSTPPRNDGVFIVSFVPGQ